jgi:hypothetical protein
MRDPIVEEVRKARMEHTQKLHGDLAAIFEDLRAHQKTCGHKIVRLPPRKPDAQGRVSGR